MNFALCTIFLALQCVATPLDLGRVKKEIPTQSDISSNAIDLNNTKAAEYISKEVTLKTADSSNKTEYSNTVSKESSAVLTINQGDSKSQVSENRKLDNPYNEAPPLFHVNEFKVRILDIGYPSSTKQNHPFQISIGPEHHPGIYIPATRPKLRATVENPESFVATGSPFTLNAQRQPLARFEHIADFPSLPESQFPEVVLGSYPSIYPIELPQYTEYPIFAGEHQIISAIPDISQLPSATPILHPANNFAVADGDYVDPEKDSVIIEAPEALLKKSNAKKTIKKDDIETSTVLNKTKDADADAGEKANK